MRLPNDRSLLPGRILAISLCALLAACQPSGGERIVADASAASEPATKPAPAHTSKPVPAMTPTPTPFQSPTAALPAATPSPATAPARPVLAPTIGAVPNTVSLSIGEELLIAADTQLRLLRIAKDSRCPKGVQCVWAGEVTLEFELKSDSGRAARFELSQTTAPRASAKGIDFELTGFGACPSGQGRMADAECAAVAISSPPER